MRPFPVTFWVRRDGRLERVLVWVDEATITDLGHILEQTLELQGDDTLVAISAFQLEREFRDRLRSLADVATLSDDGFILSTTLELQGDDTLAAVDVFSLIRQTREVPPFTLSDLAVITDSGILEQEDVVLQGDDTLVASEGYGVIRLVRVPTPASLTAWDQSECVDGNPAYRVGVSWTPTPDHRTEVYVNGQFRGIFPKGVGSEVFNVLALGGPVSVTVEARHMDDADEVGEMASTSTTLLNPC